MEVRQVKRSSALIMAILLALALLGAEVSGVAAGAEWCEDDPLVVIETPGGNLVPLYVTVGALGVEHLPAAQLAEISYTAKRTSHGNTQVKLSVVVRGDVFASSFATREDEHRPLRHADAVRRDRRHEQQDHGDAVHAAGPVIGAGGACRACRRGAG